MKESFDFKFIEILVEIIRNKQNNFYTIQKIIVFYLLINQNAEFIFRKIWKRIGQKIRISKFPRKMQNNYFCCGRLKERLFKNYY